ncbi:DUF5984 family protein [Mucilaginibacter sp. KACC 22773]|uniref:DUF5984 family protein n=1 Tax=Mucilaginibacter sp. KACC 22773 TaxID=3025671 RepID=UPI00236569B7|nr:DUF5984 family protein [Mucilaginibacter sp. KACC 22773]WDF76473.1 DUF5984 family protein [Mucilaginibacter sp. KACC 22773]
MINFKIKPPEETSGAIGENDRFTSWFFLTDGDLWLTFGDQTIYEYTSEAMEYFEDKSTPYSDYQVSRFVEDFSDIFKNIRETVPENFYELAENVTQFYKDLKHWKSLNEDGDEAHYDAFMDNVDILYSWVRERALLGIHLLGGPTLYFFRHDDKVKIVWETDFVLENGAKLWTAKNGSCEMEYDDFRKRIIEFARNYFLAMDNQIKLAIARDWGDIILDKKRLVEEQEERKFDFYSEFSKLWHEPEEKTNWEEIEEIYKLMRDELDGSR